MTVHKEKTGLRLLSILLAVLISSSFGYTDQACFAAGRETVIPDVQFQPIRLPKAVTIREAVDVAIRNYPSIAHRQFKLRAAIANVSLAKTQYMPNLNFDMQESLVSPNRIASVVMNNVSGFDTVPVDAGPSSTKASYKPITNSLQGLNLNWLLIDGGLRHANDDFAYADARAARADVRLTILDVAFETADAFLAAVAAKQNIRAAQASLDRMEAADITSRTLVSKGLKPGVDAAGWDFDVARSKIKVIKADKDVKLALVDLAEKMGMANADLDVIAEPLVHSPVEANNNFVSPLDLTSHPLALLKTAEVDRWKAKVNVLNKAYCPHLWLNSSIWGKGSGEPKTINPIPQQGGGVLPQTFNYMVGLSYSFPLLEYFPLKFEKRIAMNNELAAKANFELAMQILEKKDARARILLMEAKRVAEQTPILVEAAKVKEIKTVKRYRTGLTNMVSVAEAERALADAEVEDALAQIEVWRSILSLSYVQGDLRPFLQLVRIAEGSTAPELNPGPILRR